MEDVLDCVIVCRVALVLHALEVLAVVAEEETQFGFEIALLLPGLLSLVFVAVLWIHDYNLYK